MKKVCNNKKKEKILNFFLLLILFYLTISQSFKLLFIEKCYNTSYTITLNYYKS